MANGKPGRPPKVNPLPADGFDTAYSRLQGVLQQIGANTGEFVVRLSRMEQGRLCYLGPVTLSADLLDVVRTEYGGGDYQAAVVGPDNKIQANLGFRIGGPMRYGSAPAAAEHAAAPDPVLALLERVLLKLDQRQPAVDPVETFSKMAKAVRDIMPAPAAPQPTGTLLQEMMALMEFQDTMRERLAPSGSDETPWRLILNEGVRPTLELIRANMRNERAQGRPEAPAPAAAEHAVMPAAAAAEHAAAPAAPQVPRLVDQVPPNADPIVQLVADIPMFARKWLGNAAATAQDPAQVADQILGFLTDDQYDLIADQVERPEFPQIFASSLAAWRPHVAWFTQLSAAIRANIAQADSEGPADVESGEGQPTGSSKTA